MLDVISDIVTYMIGRAIPAALGFVVVLMFVRTMGERNYGLYSIVFAGANFVAVISINWLCQAVLRFRPGDQEWVPRFGKLVGIGIRRSCAFGVVVAAAILLIEPGRFREPLVIGAACLLVVGLILHAVYLANLQAVLRSRTVATIEIMRAILTLAGGLAGLMLIHPVYVGAIVGVGVSYLVAGVVAKALMRESSRRSGASGVEVTGAATLGVLFDFGWPNSLWLGASMAFPFIERSLIQFFLGTSVMGQYAATYDVIYRGSGFLLLPVVLAVHPRIMRAYGSDREKQAYKLWACGLAVQLLLAIVVVSAMAGAGHWIVSAIGIQSAGPGRALIVPLAAAGCIWQIALVAHKLLEAHSRTRRMLAFIVVALVADVVIDCVCLPRFGVTAAAYALLVTGALYVICVSVDGFRTVANAGALARRARNASPV